MDLTGLGGVAELASTVIEKIWPDKTEQEKQQLAAAVSLVQGQMEVNRTEAQHPSLFVAGWRPAIGWVCALALCYHFALLPVIECVFAALGNPLPKMPGIDGNLWELMFGLLGMAGLRSFDKLRGLAR